MESMSIHYFISRLISVALTSLFALVGGFMGAMAGAFTGKKASECGVLRGAGLGALAGAFLSVQALEALRSYSRQGLSGTRSSKLADYMEEHLRGRSSELQFLPDLLRPDHITDHINMNHKVANKGLSDDSLTRLPRHKILDETNPDQSICCPICLEDIKVGEIARSLPHCHHMFHQTCVDKWLTRHGSCPICRQHI